MVSTSFETGIRVLSRWEREGFVRTDADGFALSNLAHLAELSDSARQLDTATSAAAHPA
jgi:hypothetical protein